MREADDRTGKGSQCQPVPGAVRCNSHVGAMHGIPFACGQSIAHMLGDVAGVARRQGMDPSRRAWLRGLRDLKSVSELLRDVLLSTEGVQGVKQDRWSACPAVWVCAAERRRETSRHARDIVWQAICNRAPGTEQSQLQGAATNASGGSQERPHQPRTYSDGTTPNTAYLAPPTLSSRALGRPCYVIAGPSASACKHRSRRPLSFLDVQLCQSHFDIQADRLYPRYNKISAHRVCLAAFQRHSPSTAENQSWRAKAQFPLT